MDVSQPQSDASLEKITFSFGRNWQEFIEKNYNAERLAVARSHLLDFLGMQSLEGKSFLDIGCGSGIHSLAAFDSGAASVTGFDLDPASVATTRKLREWRGNPDNWRIEHGSVLDEAFLQGFSSADIVYSWGVLHHTGQMWNAVRNASRFLRNGSLFYIALYQTTPRTPHWIRVKKEYNAASPIRKRWMEYHYVLRHVMLPEVARLRNPFAPMRDYEQNRGMDFMTDIRDWLGGYPYEDASIPETLRFGRQLGLQLANIAIQPTLVEYLFEKP